MFKRILKNLFKPKPCRCAWCGVKKEDSNGWRNIDCGLEPLGHYYIIYRPACPECVEKFNLMDK